MFDQWSKQVWRDEEAKASKVVKYAGGVGVKQIQAIALIYYRENKG